MQSRSPAGWIMHGGSHAYRYEAQPATQSPHAVYTRITGFRTHQQWTKYDILRSPLPKPKEPNRYEKEAHESAPTSYRISPEAVVAWDEAPDGGGRLDDAIQHHMDSADVKQPRCVKCVCVIRRFFMSAYFLNQAPSFKLGQGVARQLGHGLHDSRY